MPTCADCGYLGRRGGLAAIANVWLDATTEQRQSGVPAYWEYLTDGRIMGPIGTARLACFKDAADLGAEAESERGTSYNTKTLAVINRDRACEAFYRVQSSNLTAEGHLRAEQVERLEELRRQTELRIAEHERESRGSMERLMSAQLQIAEATKATMDKVAMLAEEERATSGSMLKMNRRLNRALVIIGLFALLLALTPLAYPEGIPSLVERVPWNGVTTAEATTVSPSTAEPATSGLSSEPP